MIPDLLEIPAIHAAYRAGTLTPAELIAALYDRIEAYADKAVFISRISREDALAQANALDVADIERKPLLGIPYVVKDNIDAAGMPTTAACPDFAYTPAIDSTAVARLRAAGAILLGKANLDQFATGLNGSRSPYGAPRSVFNADYVSGGSSSGSAVSVGAGLAAFALGTDTAGSGRVPAAFNNLIGLKPSIGRIPTTGVVPACRSLDCISIFANSASDSIHILKILQGYDEADPYARPPAEVFLPATPRIGVLPPAQRDFAGDADCAALYETALVHARHLGWELVEIDYAPFKTIAAALYGGPFVAERLAAIKDFFSANPEALHPVVRDIIEGAQKYSAADTFQEIYRIRRLCRIAEAERAKCDALLLPTSPTIYRVDEMLADPFAKNATFGLYTNFLNFMDLGAIALPVGFRPDGMPFGV
ncbi:MAG TPA: allophanate hydrolase, partial [Acidocella sp.]|nr:allophanate hydrolase [Acidocella sp.]